MATNYEKLSRKELQALCKLNSLKANGKVNLDVLTARMWT